MEEGDDINLQSMISPIEALVDEQVKFNYLLFWASQWDVGGID